MGNQLKATLKPFNTVVLWFTGGFQEALKFSPWCRETLVSRTAFQSLPTCRNFIRLRLKSVPCRPAIGWRKENKPCITNSRPARYRFLPWTNKVSTCLEVLYVGGFLLFQTADAKRKWLAKWNLCWSSLNPSEFGLWLQFSNPNLDCNYNFPIRIWCTTCRVYTSLVNQEH